MTYGQGDQGAGAPPTGPGQPSRAAGETGPRHGYGRASVPNQAVEGRRQPEHSRPPGGTYGGGTHRHTGVYEVGAHYAGTAAVGTSRGQATPYGSPAAAADDRRPGTAAPTRAARRRRRGTGGATRRTRLMGTLAVTALAVVLSLAGYIAFFSTPSGPSAAAGPRTRDIGSQQVDPAPLAVAEVFPAATVTATQGGAAYQLVKSEQSADCRTAVVGNLSDLLATAGCTQVVRATLLSADHAYVITAGIFNLRDRDGATQAANGIQTSVTATKGRFTGFAAGGASDVIGRAPTQLGWDVQGHFLAYAVVAKADGTPITDTAGVRPTIEDMVEKYLIGRVVHARTLPAASPSGKPAPSRKK